MVTPTEKTLITFRLPRTVRDEVRQLAEREDESQSAVVRRLIRVGLRIERRSTHPDEAA